MKPITVTRRIGLLTFSLLLLGPSVLNVQSGDTLSISVTNKSGDILTNLTVGRILPEGLVLENRAGQVKIRYQDLPSEIREKYEPLALAALNKETQQAQ